MQRLNNRAASLCVSYSLFCGFTLSSSFTLCFIVWRPTLLTPFGDNAIPFLSSLYVHNVFLRFGVSFFLFFFTLIPELTSWQFSLFRLFFQCYFFCEDGVPAGQLVILSLFCLQNIKLAPLYCQNLLSRQFPECLLFSSWC